MLDEEKQNARVTKLRALLDGGLRDEHADWIKVYGVLAAKVLEQRGADAQTLEGLRAYPVLADQLLTVEDKKALDALIDEVFTLIDAAEQHGEYRASEVPAAMLAALAHRYPAAQQRHYEP